MRIFFDELEILKGHAKKIHFSFPLTEVIEGNKDMIEITEAQFTGEAKSEAGIAVVKGYCSFEVKFSCARCLNHFQESFEVPFNEQFARTFGTLAEEERDLEEINWIDTASVDLIPYCKEAIILALPYIPVCKEDCQGLCAECGADLNVAACNCKREHIDPRFAELAKLFNQEE